MVQVPPTPHGFDMPLHALVQVPPVKVKPTSQAQVYPVAGATASVQDIPLPMSPPSSQGLGEHSFLSLHAVVPVPVYAAPQVQV